MCGKVNVTVGSGSYKQRNVYMEEQLRERERERERERGGQGGLTEREKRKKGGKERETQRLD